MNSSNGVDDQFASNVENLKNSFCDFQNAFSDSVSAILYGGCGSGWHPILEETHIELYKIDPDYKLISVAQHDGELQYIFSTPRKDLYPAMHTIVTAAHKQCSETCEYCGNDNDVYKREDSNEWTVLCKGCWNDYSFGRYTWKN